MLPVFAHFSKFSMYAWGKQARKSSEDAQAAGYTWFKFFWAGESFGSKKFGPKIICIDFSADKENNLLSIFCIVFYFQRICSHRPLGWQGGVPDEGGRRHIVVFSNKQQNLGKNRALSV